MPRNFKIIVILKGIVENNEQIDSERAIYQYSQVSVWKWDYKVFWRWESYGQKEVNVCSDESMYHIMW